MSKKMVPSEFVEQRFCDICGKMISDGQHDGLGDTNFWGAYIDMIKAKPEYTEMKSTDASTALGSFLIRVKVSFADMKHYEVCRFCMKSVEQFIDMLKSNLEKIDES